jgi:hypothetical protein
VNLALGNFGSFWCSFSSCKVIFNIIVGEENFMDLE